MKKGIYGFAGFVLDAGARQLTGLDGNPVKLSSRAFDLLVLLVAHRGETLTKRRLLRDVWPDVVVSENNLNQAVVAIRRALGDDKERRRLVQTVPGRGFCFVGDVRNDAAMRAIAEPASEPVYTVADYFSAPEPARRACGEQCSEEGRSTRLAVAEEIHDRKQDHRAEE